MKRHNEILFSQPQSNIFHNYSQPSNCVASVLKIISIHSTVCCLFLTTVLIFTGVLLKLLFGSAEQTQRQIILDSKLFLVQQPKNFDGSSRSALVVAAC